MRKNKRKNYKDGGSIIDFSRRRLTSDQEDHVRELIMRSIVPIDQRINALVGKLETMRANYIVTNTLLEKNKIIDREKYIEEYNAFMSKGGEFPDEFGRMAGKFVISLYNLTSGDRHADR